MQPGFVARIGAMVCGATLCLLAPWARAEDAKAITSWDIRTNNSGAKIIDDAVARFQKANPGVKVEVSHVLNDAYKTKLKIAFGANQPPCLFISWGGGPLREYVKSGQVLELTPYLDKNKAYKDRFLPAGFKSATFGGKIYGVPAENTAPAVVFYNKEMFAKYGLKPPANWDELLKVMEVLKKNGIAPFSLANKNKWTGSMYYMYIVDRLAGPEAFRAAADRQPGASFAGPAFVEAGKRVQELVKLGAFAQGYNGLDYDVGASRKLLYSEKAAMEVMGTWEAGAIQSENPEFYKKLDFFGFPAVPGGKGDPGNVIGTVGDNFISMSTACKDPALAFKLIEAMTDDISIQARLEDKRLVPMKGLNPSDPFLKRVAELIAKASSVQLWYDQELPPKLGEVHKDTVQALFGLSLTPEAAAQQMEEAAKAELH
jgi:raffinose/stachyose/melibiose transport system substrate-binding protein